MFEETVSSGVPRRVFLSVPFTLAGLLAVYSRARRPDVPFRNDVGSGEDVTVAVFGPNGEHASTGQLRKIVKTEDEWKQALSKAEFAVTRRKGTERAFTGRYWQNHDRGLYQCVGCGTTLFRSQEKFESGTGWPSFWAPAAETNVSYQTDHALLMERVEVLCARCDAHLGHVFDDGPAPTGKRYCMNSAALRFEPAAS